MLSRGSQHCWDQNPKVPFGHFQGERMTYCCSRITGLSELADRVSNVFMQSRKGLYGRSHVTYSAYLFIHGKTCDTSFVVKRTNFGIKQTSTKILNLSLTSLSKSFHFPEPCFLSFGNNNKPTPRIYSKDKMNLYLRRHLGQGLMKSQDLGRPEGLEHIIPTLPITEALRLFDYKDVGLCVH